MTGIAKRYKGWGAVVMMALAAVIIAAGCGKSSSSGGTDGRRRPLPGHSDAVPAGAIPIASFADLCRIGKDAKFPLDGTYVLTRDIDASASRGMNGGQGFEPVGRYTASRQTPSLAFSGSFYGRGHTISGLYINRPDSNYIGLFGYISGDKALVSGVHLVDVSVIGNDAVGGLAGSQDGGVISNSSVFGGTVRSSKSAGSGVGGTILGNYLPGSVGGLAGASYTVEDCYSTATVGGGSGAGGLVGTNYSVVKRSYAAGVVEGDGGGLVGNNVDGEIIDSYSATVVTGESGGGLVHDIPSSCRACGSQITNSYSVGPVTGGGLVRGAASYVDFISSYWDTEASGASTSGCWLPYGSSDAETKECGEINGRTTARMMLRSNYEGWDFEKIWQMDDGRGYPYLRALGPTLLSPAAAAALAQPKALNPQTVALRKAFAGAQTDTGWYTEKNQTFKISTAAQMAGLMYIVNSGRSAFNGKTVTLTADISLSAYGKGTAFNGGKGWIPIGRDGSSFRGTFDGGGKRISGLYINDAALANAGLFGHVAGGTLKNVTVADADITGGNNTGGVVGNAVVGDSVANCRVAGKVRGASNVGGVAGNGKVFGSHSSAEVSGTDMVGGVAGTGDVRGSYSTGAVKGNNNVGGVTGGVVGFGGAANSYSTGTVSGNNDVGGVIGGVFGFGGAVNSYSTGTVSGSNNVGGVAGRILGGSVSGCYSTGEVSGSNYVGGVVGLAGYLEEFVERAGEGIFGGGITGSAALNPSVKGSRVGRVVGGRENKPAGFDDEAYEGTALRSEISISNNTAFAGLKDRGDRTDRWTVKGPDTTDGEDITAEKIIADPTLGGRFKEKGDDGAATGWKIEPGKLPGLGGRAAEMPGHLK